MSKKHIFFIICTVFALCAITFAFTGCSENTTEEAFGEWEAVTLPTCEEAGLAIRVSLSDPLVTQTREIPALGHDWNEWTTKTEPTCLLAGVETRTCKTCENLDMRSVPALGHDWGDWNTELAATCDNNGAQSRTCLRDENHTEHRAIPSLGHDFGDWVITRAPSCTESGIETRYCRNCNDHTEVRAIEPYGHSWSPFVVTKAPTCTEDGEKISVCSNDATHIKKDSIKAMGHSYGEWIHSKLATESEDGEDMRVCRRDASHIETKTVPATGSEGLRFGLLEDKNEYYVRNHQNVSGIVYIPATYNGLPVTVIATGAFDGCSEIEKIVFLGNNLRTVKPYAFKGCVKLQSVEFSEGISDIMPFVFHDCVSLKSVSFPSTVISLGRMLPNNGRYISLFRNCPELINITVAEGNSVYKVESGCLIDHTENTLITGTKNAVIPNYIREIADCAFSYTAYNGIESVHIPASVEIIGSGAFENCKKLSDLTFENGALTVLNTSAFRGCDSLEHVELPENLIEIRYAFKDCTSLSEVVFGSKLEIIGPYTFDGCNDLTVCEIPASVRCIEEMAFTNAAFEALTVASDSPYFVKDNNCLIELESNKLIAGAGDSVIPDYVTFIGKYAFQGRNIQNVVIPEGVTGIGASAFANCSSLKSVSFKGNSKLEAIGEEAFKNCTSLSGIDLPANLQKIYRLAFYGCSSLTSVTFGAQEGEASKLESIGDHAFDRTALSSFVIPASVTEMGKHVFGSAALTLTSLTVEEGNTAYKAESGCLIEIATQKLIFAFGDVTIPECVKIIGIRAFEFCTSERIVIPASVESADRSAFLGLEENCTIVLKGFASEEEANAAWGVDWKDFCFANIVYGE